MEKGSKVRTIYGKIETVCMADDTAIITYESAKTNSWYHPTKVTEVFWSQILKRYVTIPE